jgi:hypothetical protein
MSGLTSDFMEGHFIEGEHVFVDPKALRSNDCIKLPRSGKLFFIVWDVAAVFPQFIPVQDVSCYTDLKVVVASAEESMTCSCHCGRCHRGQHCKNSENGCFVE